MTDTSTTNRWADLWFGTVSRITEGFTSRSMWVMVVASLGAYAVLQMHAAGKVSELLAQSAMVAWVGAFLGGAMKRGITTVAAIKAESKVSEAVSMRNGNGR